MASDVLLHSMNNFMIQLQNFRIKVELSEENSQEHTYFCSLISTEQAFEIKVQIRFFSFFLNIFLTTKGSADENKLTKSNAWSIQTITDKSLNINGVIWRFRFNNASRFYQGNTYFESENLVWLKVKFIQ